MGTVYKLSRGTTRVQREVIEWAGRGEDHYGYGVWIGSGTSGSLIYRAEGMDPGVSVVSDMWMADELSITVISNTDGSVWPIYRAIAGAISGG